MIKKTIQKCLVLLALGLSSLTLNAQSENEQTKTNKFEIGLNAGVALANISSPRGTSTKAKFSYNFGASATYYISESFGIKTKLLYDNKGYGDGEILNTITNQFERTDVNLNYLTIPVIASYFVGNNAKFFINAGPYIGLLLSAKDTNKDTDLKEAFAKSEYGIAAGMGVIFPTISNASAFIELDSQFGISDPTAIETASIRTRRYAIVFGVLFLLD